MGLVAQNVSVEVRSTTDVQVLGVLTDHPITQVPGGMQVSLGDACGDERRRVVFELQIPSLAALGPAKVADVVVRYVQVGEQIAAHELRLPLMVNLVSADEAAAQTPDAEVTEEVTVLHAAREQDRARELADEGSFEQARQTLLDAAARLREKAATSADPEELLARAAQIEGSAASMSEEGYGVSRKLLMYRSIEMKLRRAKLREQQQREEDER